MNIDVVIPNYNGSSLVKKNLPIVILEMEKYGGSIIVVDDGSREEELNNLSKFISKLGSKNVILIKNEKNLGFSSTVNRGVAKSNADFVVFLNTDVSPEKNFLEAALKDMQSDENLFGVGLMDKSIEGEKTILRGRGQAIWGRGFLQHTRGEVDKTDTFWISGGSSIVKRDVFKKLSGFDTLYNPFYWEDIDLSYRARKSGYKIKFQPKSIVIHRHHEGAIKKHFNEFQVNTTAYRNQFIFVWKNITEFNLIISHIMWLPLHLLMAVLRGDIAFLLGLVRAIAKLPAIIVRRSEQKKLYKLRDSDLIMS